MAFQEFHTIFSSGANINAGDLTANGIVTSTNGNWSTVTNIFTATGGTPFSGVTANVDYVSIYLDGATVTPFIALVTAVGGGGLTLTVSATKRSGTPPTTGATGISATTGGAWKGPNAAASFPFGTVSSAAQNNAGDGPRINMKSGTTYAMTAGITQSQAGIRVQGYTTTIADGGRATIDGGTSGASYTLATLSGTNCDYRSLIFSNNGSNSGSASLVSLSGTGSTMGDCVYTGGIGNGISITAAGGILIKCEAYGNNISNAANSGGVAAAAEAVQCIRVISHDNTGSNSAGFVTSGANEAVFDFCIADTNGGIGFNLSATRGNTVKQCESYNNTSHGIALANSSAAQFYIENSNLIKNGGWGINGTGAGGRNGTIVNCGFGSGTAANTSGTTTGLKGIVESGSVSYASNVTPWVDPANGDFRINLAAAIGTGIGTYLETASGYAGTIGYPDIGAAQAQPSSGGGLAIPVSGRIIA